MPIAALVEQIMIQAINRGWANQSTASLFRLQEEAAGIEVRSHRSAARLVTTRCRFTRRNTTLDERKIQNADEASCQNCLEENRPNPREGGLILSEFLF